MWPLILVVSCFAIGLTIGYTHNKKKVPFVKFVNPDEKEAVLTEYGIELGESSVCSVCGDKVTLDNLGLVIPKNDEKQFICSKQSCMTVSDITTP